MIVLTDRSTLPILPTFWCRCRQAEKCHKSLHQASGLFDQLLAEPLVSGPEIRAIREQTIFDGRVKSYHDCWVEPTESRPAMFSLALFVPRIAA